MSLALWGIRETLHRGGIFMAEYVCVPEHKTPQQVAEEMFQNVEKMGDSVAETRRRKREEEENLERSNALHKQHYGE